MFLDPKKLIKEYNKQPPHTKAKLDSLANDSKLDDYVSMVKWFEKNGFYRFMGKLLYGPLANLHKAIEGWKEKFARHKGNKVEAPQDVLAQAGISPSLQNIVSDLRKMLDNSKLEGDEATQAVMSLMNSMANETETNEDNLDQRR